MEQTNTTTPESAPVATPDAGAAPVSAPMQIDGEAGASVGGGEDAYTKALRERFGSKKPESAPASDKSEKKDGGDGAPAAAKETKKSTETRDEKHEKWWKGKTPEEKARISEKQNRSELRKATERLKAVEAELAALKGKKSADAAKTHDDFDNDEDWIRYAVDNRLMEIEKERQKDADEQAKQSEKSQKWAEAMKASFPDEEERAAAGELFKTEVSELPVATSVLSYIVESGNPRLLLHLVRNPSAQKLLAPGTPELLVGARLAKIERWLEGKRNAKLVDTNAKPAVNTATHEPALNSATGSANNIGSASVATKSREADLRDMQRRILG